MYLIVVFNSGQDGHARRGGEFTLIRVPINWKDKMAATGFDREEELIDLNLFITKASFRYWSNQLCKFVL